ncbi:thiol reductant ABC exporter subunit CydD [Geomonas sp. Red32]|uniref:thiol reductant ABC exporter subunit CydD n=1 Tax=Geomonas sp. Red32 TaxID=2912856 RepID=UPI00202CB3BA|nr:thiol reductant ABC exporter subunit CydD [Geomonas sp. Red32]MCM0083039.1 thiol reductant ABC exporter subunit CydD [Geomonas sp. Red32]
MTERLNTAETTPEQWLKKECLALRPLLLQAAGFGAVAGFLIVLQARLLASGCHQVIMEKAPVARIVPLAAFAALTVLVRTIFTLFAERQAAAASASLKSRVRSRLYRRLQELGPAGTVGEEAAPLVETVTTAVDGLDGYISRFLPQMVLAAAIPLCMMLFVLGVEWRAALVLLFSAPFIPFFMILIGKGSEAIHRRQWEQLSRMAGYLLDLIQGLPDLRMFQAAKREASEVARVSAEYRHATMAVLRIAFLSALTLEFFSTMGTAIVAVVVGFRLLSGALPLVDGLFVLFIAPEFYLPLRNLGLSHHARMQSLTAAERIFRLLSLPDVSGYQGTSALPPGPPSIRFQSVTFRYGGNRGGITELDLDIPGGSITALAGESGAGKTTVARLLVGLSRPESGRITVNGADLADLSPRAWHASIAWVPQKPFFFKGTVRENLLLGCPSASEEEIQTALADASADFVERLPLGLETPLGGGGAGLSGGEQRRLALARAFLRQASLVVLDEPTAGLDAANEEMVGNALRRLAKGRTVLVISHREETLRLVQRVAVMTGGRLQGVMTAADFLDRVSLTEAV